MLNTWWRPMIAREIPLPKSPPELFFFLFVVFFLRLGGPVLPFFSVFAVPCQFRASCCVPPVGRRRSPCPAPSFPAIPPCASCNYELLPLPPFLFWLIDVSVPSNFRDEFMKSFLTFPLTIDRPILCVSPLPPPATWHLAVPVTYVYLSGRLRTRFGGP